MGLSKSRMMHQITSDNRHRMYEIRKGVSDGSLKKENVIEEYQSLQKDLDNMQPFFRKAQVESMIIHNALAKHHGCETLYLDNEILSILKNTKNNE